MLRVEYNLHLTYATATVLFCREEQMPFAPFIGLDVYDDVLGEFKIEHIAWCNNPQMIICQSSVDRKDWSLRQATRQLGRSGWQEVKEARGSYERASSVKPRQLPSGMQSVEGSTQA